LNGLFSMTSVEPQWLLVVPCGAAIMVLLDQVRRVASREGREQPAQTPPPHPAAV